MRRRPGSSRARHARIAATAQPALVRPGDRRSDARPSHRRSGARRPARPPIAGCAATRTRALCTPIEGAHADTYTAAAADVGRILVAVVSASKQSVLSAASAVVRTTPGPVGRRAPDDRRHARAGPATDRRRGHVDRQRADLVRVPVVALRRARRALQHDPRRDAHDVHAGRRRRRAHARADRPRDRRDGRRRRRTRRSPGSSPRPRRSPRARSRHSRGSRRSARR